MLFRSQFVMILLLPIIGLLIGCADRETKSDKTLPVKKVKESLVDANKKVVKTEEQHIRDLIARYGWEMNETGTGLRYMIYEEGNGPSIVTGDIVEIGYEVRLITGDRVYSSNEQGNLVFKVGKAEVISGLEQGILLLNVGDKAKFVIPSHLAYGLLGDDNKIPTKATLIYDIQVIQKK
jgi:FKBP-type peptidyl-prolyl cis-trans isomerase